MKKLKKMITKCNICINKYKKLNSTIPKSSESFKWKEVNWKKVELRLNIFQNKIYAAKKKSKYPKGQKISKANFEFLGFKIKHFDTKKHSAKNNQGHKIGFRLLIFSSKNSRNKHFATIDPYCVKIRPRSNLRLLGN